MTGEFDEEPKIPLPIAEILTKLQDNGPEKWHDALTKYTELEKRIADLERWLEELQDAFDGHKRYHN